MHRLFAALGLTALVACSGAADPSKDTAKERAPSSGQEEAPPATHPPMAKHFEAAAQIRDAAIAGELEDLRAPARWLADEIRAVDYPETWRPYVLRMQREAQAIVAVQDIGAAAAMAATLASVCGECHRALGVGPRPQALDLPDPVDGVGPHMMRHQWAAERMWEGLIAPSDAAWARGAAALAEAPMHAEALTENVELPEEIVALRRRVHELATSGQAVREPAHRAALYGEFLASCATCHKGGC